MAKTKGFGGLIEKALEQNRAIKACERSGGHDYQPSPEVRFSQDEAWKMKRCSRCGLLKFVERIEEV